MNKLPLQASGKVNKTALNLAGIESDDSLVVEPGTATEKALCEIFGTVLRRRHLSIHQNFFDAGGHSLTALELIYRINEAFGVEFRLSDLFAFPSVFRLSQKLEPKFEAPNPLFERSDLQDHKR